MEPTTTAAIDFGRVRDALAPVLAAHGVSLVDVEWTTERSGWTLRLIIERVPVDDKPAPRTAPAALDESGGVTLDDCAHVSRDASSVLDVEDLIPHRYNLEVSSPGLERRLRSPAEFARFAGRLVKAKLSRPAPDGQRVLRGELLEAREGRVAVAVDGKRIEVPLEDVVEARLVFELTPQPKKRQKQSGGPAAEGASRPAKRSDRGSEKRK